MLEIALGRFNMSPAELYDLTMFEWSCKCEGYRISNDKEYADNKLRNRKSGGMSVMKLDRMIADYYGSE